MVTEPSPRPWRARITLIVLFALFFVPILGSMTMLILKPGWTPFGTVNLGELIQPPPALEVGRARVTVAGDETLADLIGDHWAFVHVSDAGCPQPCEEALVAMRQARLALGKEADRVRRLWLVVDPGTPDRIDDILTALPGLHAYRVPPQVAAAFPGRTADSLYVLDPAGLIILRYDGATSASHLHKDMKRLLKISKQG